MDCQSSEYLTETFAGITVLHFLGKCLSGSNTNRQNQRIRETISNIRDSTDFTLIFVLAFLSFFFSCLLFTSVNIADCWYFPTHRYPISFIHTTHRFLFSLDSPGIREVEILSLMFE